MPETIPSRDTFDDVVDLLEAHDKAAFFLILAYENSAVYHQANSRFTPVQFAVFKRSLLKALDDLENRVEDQS